MTHVILDSTTMARLHGLSDPMEFFDEDGRSLGYFQPALTKAETDRLMAACPFSDEQLREFGRQERRGRPLSEILDDLGRP